VKRPRDPRDPFVRRLTALGFVEHLAYPRCYCDERLWVMLPDHGGWYACNHDTGAPFRTRDELDLALLYLTLRGEKREPDRVPLFRYE